MSNPKTEVDDPRVFTGGGRIGGGLNYSWPFATLSFDRTQMTLRTTFFGLFHSVATIQRQNLISVRQRPWWSRGGLEFTYRHESGAANVLVFHAVPSRGFKEALRRYGWPDGDAP